MAPNTSPPAKVLVVDDESAVADVQALKLEDSYETVVAYGGREALEKFDGSVDAVLLDRRMPDRSGGEVLAELRDRNHDCVVVMTTAVDPDLNILEMDFDDYLVKPIETESLHAALDQLLESRSNDPRLSEFFSLVSKIEVLESELPPDELAESAEYDDLKRRAEQLGLELDQSHADFEDIVETFRDVNRGRS